MEGNERDVMKKSRPQVAQSKMGETKYSTAKINVKWGNSNMRKVHVIHTNITK